LFESGGDTLREDRLGVIEGFSLPGGDLGTCRGGGWRESARGGLTP